MNQEEFKRIVATISSELRLREGYGEPISSEFIEEVVDKTIENLKKQIKNFNYEDTDVTRLKFELRNLFDISIDDESIILGNPDAIRWLDNKKSKISWDHWNAYKAMLLSQARASEVIDKNEEVIDQILDLSSDPTLPGKWSRKGLVMGNVQSGKTQNYLGLINKAMDAGYKVIILLGGHLVDLRKQTQERVDEGILGRESRHLIEQNRKKPAPIGVGEHGGKNVNAGTTTLADFNKASAQRLNITLTKDGDPFIFCIKKHKRVMEELYKWIINHHYLAPENGRKMEVPLLLIDDEADYASINTKHHKEEVTATNDALRNLLSLFHRNTYVGYTATPFANIFIDPDENSYTDEDDLFPSDFMVKLPTPNNYMGQNFFFKENAEDEDMVEKDSPVIEINDHWPIFELKKYDLITMLPESLKEAIRAFIIVIAIRSLRGESKSHNTMLVNISHLKDHQNTLEVLIEEYRKNIYDALQSFSNLGFKEARHNLYVKNLSETFNEIFNVPEDFEKIFTSKNHILNFC